MHYVAEIQNPDCTSINAAVVFDLLERRLQAKGVRLTREEERRVAAAVLDAVEQQLVASIDQTAARFSAAQQAEHARQMQEALQVALLNQLAALTAAVERLGGPATVTLERDREGRTVRARREPQ